jgi:DNA-binding transcriptional LysR family regulator
MGKQSMSKLDQMEIFYFVATWNSFSRAAIELDVSKGFVSSQISALEKDLKVKLLHRSTRHLSLTEEGNLFLESCAKIVREKQLATSILKQSQAEPSGHLKITAPPSMCHTFLSELLPKFQKKYRKISLTIDSSSSIKNLLQHGIDIALRITSTPDENHIARVITTFRFVICATPKYLKNIQSPKIQMIFYKQSVREEAERIKAEFDRLSADNKINNETKILFHSMFMLINLLISIFLEKTTAKNNKNSSKPSSQTEKEKNSAKENM